MRATLHLFTVEDFLLLRGALQPVLAVAAESIVKQRGPMPDVDKLIALAREFIAAEPRSFAELSAMLEKIRGADAAERVTLLPQFMDTEIGARALENFQPAVPVTIEGLAYGGGGFLLGYLFSSGLIRFLMLPFRRRERVVRA